MKIFKNLTRRELGFGLICVVMVVLQVWLELTMPDYTSSLTTEISGAIARGRTVTTSVILKNGGMMMLCAFGSLLASVVCGYFAANIAAGLARTLRSRLFDRISSFSNAELNRFGVPSLITRTTNDVVQMQMLVAMGLQVMVRAPIMAVWAITKISFSSIYWTSAALITVGCILAVVSILVSLCFPRFRKIQKLTDRLNDTARETLSGVRVVRAFNAEGYQQDRFEAVNREITANNLFTSRTMGLLFPTMSVAMNALTLSIYWIGAWLINEASLLNKAAVMGEMVAFTQYALQIVMSFMMLTAIFIILPRVMVSAHRINEVLDTQPAITYPDAPVSKTESGRVEFKDVSFSYGGESPCLSGLSFAIEPGQTFAIIGATGTGKTTLIDLIPRFYDATEGSVLIDGVDIRRYPREQLTSLVSIAPQKAVLFGGTIASNVSYGSKEDPARLDLALDIARADFVAELPEGTGASVAQGGTNFSGGQKQRLSIARAVYKDAEIYIFDDTFSALDYKTDMLVRKGLREHLKGKTIVIVAQRIGTIRDADRILVLDEGRIAGIGTHSQLLESCPVYKEIALSQLSKEEL